ncbi:hypothetical protein [Clostridium tyrobutyricum]|uniref:hypothetical protein n=1 Tax=Clostridium tyrobutyricum TaxID=1519 RepID=UPI0018A00FFC|nr:hypothetical protein [Clostridium tyrobutyricum]
MKKSICLVTDSTIILGISSIQVTNTAEISNSISKTYSSSSIVTPSKNYNFERVIGQYRNCKPRNIAFGQEDRSFKCTV